MFYVYIAIDHRHGTQPSSSRPPWFPICYGLRCSLMCSQTWILVGVEHLFLIGSLTLDHIGFPFAPGTDLYITAASASACIDEMDQRDKVQAGPILWQGNVVNLL